MAFNKLALIRYKTIDRCLLNRYRKWTLDDLIDKVSEALYEFEGIENGVSKRTIQADIQFMRSDKLGYNAPIVVSGRKYYSYEDSTYSISHSRLTEADIDKMDEIVSVLKQMSGFDYFDDMKDIVARLENSFRKSASNGKSFIQLEGNHRLKGISHVAPLYQAILKKMPLLISYKSFKQEVAVQGVYYPYLLKEHRNRWFLICGAQKSSALHTLALDRIEAFLEMHPKDFVPYTGVDFERYFSETIGVTRSEKDRPHNVTLWIDKKNAPYVLTKPIHRSQVVLKEQEDGVVIRLDVTLNFELERELLGFGDSIKVLGPRILQKRIKETVAHMYKRYFEQL